MRQFLLLLIAFTLGCPAFAQGLQGPLVRSVPLGTTQNSYAASFAYFTPYATPTDIVAISGSPTRVVKVRKIILSSTQTTAGINQFFLITRAVANTGGSPSAGTAVPFDPLDAASTASVVKYTAAPTITSTVGTVLTSEALSPAPASVAAGDVILYDATANDRQPITLRGTAQQLCLNFNGAAVPVGLSMAVTVFWTEE